MQDLFGNEIKTGDILLCLNGGHKEDSEIYPCKPDIFEKTYEKFD